MVGRKPYLPEVKCDKFRPGGTYMLNHAPCYALDLSVIGKFAFAPSYLRLHSNVQLLNARGYFRDDLSPDCIGLHVLWERKYAHMASNSIHLTILVHTDRQKTSTKLFW